MKLLRIVAVLLVVTAGAGGYYYSVISSNSPGDERSRSAPESPTTENDESFPQENDDESPYTTRRAEVLEVFDGDTLKVRLLQNGETKRIRIKGIDCPESSREVDKCWSDKDLIDIPCEEQVPLGIRATSFAKARLDGETVELESYNGFDEGEHGRTLAYVRTPRGEDYGLKSVKKGYCKDSGVRYDHPRDDTYEKHRQSIKR